VGQMKKKGAGGPSNRNPLPLFNAANPSCLAGHFFC